MKKICFIISNPKDIDYYINFLNNLDNSQFDILYNDFKDVWRKKIIKDFKKKFYKFNIKKLSSIYFLKKKYDILISTGDSPPANFLYLIMIKLNLNKIYYFVDKFIFKLDRKIRKIINVKLKQKEDFRQVDYFIGKKRFCFPRGYDLKPSYPGISRLQTFTNFLCHGEIHKEIILSNGNIPTKIIGYPRYDVKVDCVKIIQSLKEEFNINNNKKIIFWLPSYRSAKVTNPDEGIDHWINEVKELTHSFNVIIRPHPERIANFPQLLNKLKLNKMIVDLNSTRSLVEIYKSVDYVMCELSGPYFSAIYNKTKILVLDHHSKKDMHLKIKSILNDNLKFYLADEESIKKNKKTLKQYFEDCDFWLNQEKTTDKLYDIFYGKKKISKDFDILNLN